MREIIAAALAPLLFGCVTTVADLHASPPWRTFQTDKPAQQYAACLARQWESRSGSTNMIPLADGMRLNLSYVLVSSTVVAVSVDVEDKGESRLVSVRARQGDNSEKLLREVTSCI